MARGRGFGGGEAPNGMGTFAIFLLIVTLVALSVPWLNTLTNAGLADFTQWTQWLNGVYLIVPAIALAALLVFGVRSALASRARSAAPEETPRSTVSSPSKILSSNHFKTITAERPTTRFKDVAGVEEGKRRA